MARPKVKFNCLQCGDSFFDWVSQRKNGGKYCSKECHNQSMKSHLKSECEQCKKIFSITPTDVKLGRGKFCSKECYNDARTRKSKCGTCGVVFKSLPSKKRKYCSLACSSKAQKKRVARECTWCGMAFTVKPVTIKRGHGKFCSQTCRANYNLKHNVVYKGTSIEKAIESELIKLGINYESQARIGRYLCDFYINDWNLVVECDGDYWHSLPENIQRDKKKDNWMKENGYNIIRLKESEIRKDAEACLIKHLSLLEPSIS